MRFKKILYMVLPLIVVPFLLSGSIEAANPTLPPATYTAAWQSTQTKTIPVWGFKPAKPKIVWQQMDNGRFTASATGFSTADRSPVAYPGGAFVPEARNETLTLDITPYIADSWKDGSGTQIPNSNIVSGSAVISPNDSEYDSSITSFSGVGNPTTVAGKYGYVTAAGWMGGQSIPPSYFGIYAGNKWQVEYEIGMNIVWLAKAEQKKTLKGDKSTITLPTTSSTDTLHALVLTEGYEAASWLDVTSRVTFSSSNPGVATIDASGNIKAVTGGTTTITIRFDNNGFQLETKVSVGVTTTPTDPGNGGNPGGGNGGSGGSGRIVFTPDNSDALESPIVRGWARSNIPVTAKVVDYEPVLLEKSVTGTETYSSTCYGKDEKGKDYSFSCDKTRSTTVPYKAVIEANINDIQITGAASGTNNVTISTEGSNLTLSGKVTWKTVVETWNPPSNVVADKPSPPSPPADITGNSGVFKLDKTAPNQSVAPTSVPWTNLPIYISINHSDNLSGFFGTGYSLSNLSYYGIGGQTQSASEMALNWNPTITINQQGVYTLQTTLGDYAGWPVASSSGPQTYNFSTYRYDAVSPYNAEFAAGNNGAVVSGTFDYVAGEDNTVRIRVGDDLSGVSYTEFSWSKSPGNSNDNGWGWNYVPVTTPDYASGAGQMSGWVDINVDSKTQYNSNQATSYADLKEGTWYLHVRQTDRAGNVQTSVSPPIFVNKLKNLRVTGIADFSWDTVFFTPAKTDTSTAVNGIGVSDMPIYTNKKHNNISLGYSVFYKFDTVGFDDPNDYVMLKIDYHHIDRNGNLNLFIDPYTETAAGDFVSLAGGEYNGQANLVQFGMSVNTDKKIGYEPTISLNAPYINLYNAELYKNRYSAYKSRTFLPPSTKFVPHGAKFDLGDKSNWLNYRILVTYTLEAHRIGHASPLRYTWKEDRWAANNAWPSGGNEYGQNRPTGTDVLGFGVNKGQTFWYDLQHTAKDDLKFYRQW